MVILAHIARAKPVKKLFGCRTEIRKKPKGLFRSPTSIDRGCIAPSTRSFLVNQDDEQVKFQTDKDCQPTSEAGSSIPDSQELKFVKQSQII